MKKILFVLIVVLAAANFAAAQNYSPSTDVLGAHLNYGRGCTACHAPHSGVFGNGNAGGGDNSTSGNIALWGQDVGSLYGKTLQTGQSSHGGPVPETLPASFDAGTPDVGGVLTCLSCHDGNYAQGAMMQNKVFEDLPATYGNKNSIPTLLGKDGTTAGNYLNDHPVGLNAQMSCGGTYDWDCTIDATGKVLMTGAKSALFVQNYGFFVRPSAYNNQPVVLCTTCHNQHVMNVVKVTKGPNSGLATGYYQTMFFIRAPYNPGNTAKGANSTAQFCRQCHGAEANEMNNGTAGTIF